MIKIICNFIGILALILTSQIYACESIGDDLKNSLLFKDHGCLQKRNSDKDFTQYTYTSPHYNILAYESVIISDVVINQKAGDTVNQEALDQIKKELENSVESRIAAVRKITQSSGPSTVRLEVAFSGAQLTGEGLGLLDIVPIKALWNIGKKLSDNNTKVPVVMLESRLTNSETGELLKSRIMLVQGEPFVEREFTQGAFIDLARKAVYKAFTSGSRH
jgi:hypothetical protein